MPQAVELMQMLDARERRSFRQRALLEQYGKTLVSFSMNIAGPIKNSRDIYRAFVWGESLLKDQIGVMGGNVIYEESICAVTGPEGLYVVSLSPEKTKALACSVEEESPLGRLYDMDILSPEGEHLSRPLQRRCLLCDKPAKECARNRTHSVEELQAKTRELLTEALSSFDAETAASLALRSLLYEVAVTPKPGLVDREGNGSHRDMDMFTFLSSASVLTPYFASCVKIGQGSKTEPAPRTLELLRFPGRQAEAEMKKASGGVNTHKGAIYSMGLLCAALGRLPREEWGEPKKILDEVAKMTAGSVERELSHIHSPSPSLTPSSTSSETPLESPSPSMLSAGQRIYAAHGITGVRGEAEKGFPEVLNVGLPTLERGLREKKSNDEAGRAALLAILANTNDTNMISRGGLSLLEVKRKQIQAILEREAYPSRETMEELDRDFVSLNLSPGGSADLLALCWMLHFLKELPCPNYETACQEDET